MQAIIRGQSPERISTAVMGTVLECHDQGFHFLGGMVPGAYDEDLQVQMQAGLPEFYWTVWPGYNGEAGIGLGVVPLSMSPFPVSNERMSAESVGESAVRHPQRDDGEGPRREAGLSFRGRDGEK